MEGKAMSERELSDPISMRLPIDILADMEEIASICQRSRSWVFVRAMKAYLAAEGGEILDLAQARRDIENGEGQDLDEVIAEVDAILKDAAA
jgi:predicted transcriptional regulator